MNKDSPKDFKELNPDDVIYINEDQQPKSAPPADPPLPEPPAADPDPLPAPKPLIINLPQEEKKQPPSKEREALTSPKPKPPIFDIPILERPEPEVRPPDPPQIADIAPPPPPELEPEEKLFEDLPEPEPADVEEPAEAESPLPPLPAIPEPESSLPPEEPIPPPPPPSFPQDIHPEPEVRLPAPPQIADIVPPPPPPPPLPSELMLPPPIEPEQPPLPPPPPPPVIPDQSPLATTDLQGNWGSPATLSPPAPPPALPIPVIREEKQPEAISEDAEEEAIQAVPQRGTKHLKIFGILTFSLIMATLIVSIFVLQPYVRDILESKRSEDAKIFEDVLVNMLQTDNQQLEVEITDNQLKQIQPALESQEEIEDGEIVVNNITKVDYAPDFSRPVMVSKFRFDLDLQTEKRDNFVLDVVTVFNSQGAYFMIEDLSINNEPRGLDQTEFVRRWSDLEALLQVQSASEDAPLSENQSIILNYVANLLKLYSHPHYLFLLPVFNITQSQEYNQAREILLASQAYYLHTGSCKPALGGQRSCRLTIDYEQLHKLYADIYEVLGISLPTYYEILLTADQDNSNLPKTVTLTFDAERNYPVLLEAPVNEGEISASRLEISYREFDVTNLDVPSVSDPLDLVEYHRQILEYEAQQLL